MLNNVYLIGIILLILPSAQAVSYLSASGQLAGKLEDEQLEFYHSDSLGSTRAITDELGAVTERQKNLPFGGILDGDEKYGFTGKELDESGLQYFGSRYYDSGTGRFISTDPAMQYHSPYVYSGNNPVAYKDPDGNMAQFAPAIPFLATPLGWAFIGGGLIITGFMAWQGQQWLEGYEITDLGPFNEEYRPASMPDLTEGFTAAPALDLTERLTPAPADATRFVEGYSTPNMPDMSILFAKNIGEEFGMGWALSVEEAVRISKSRKESVSGVIGQDGNYILWDPESESSSGASHTSCGTWLDTRMEEITSFTIHTRGDTAAISLQQIFNRGVEIPDREHTRRLDSLFGEHFGTMEITKVTAGGRTKLPTMSDYLRE